MRVWNKFIVVLTLAILILLPSVTSQAEEADKPNVDAWTALEDEQLGLTMAKLLDDTNQKELSAAAQKRYGLDEDGGERFMICVMGLSGHPDFTAAKVKEALDICSRNMAPARH